MNCSSRTHLLNTAAAKYCQDRNQESLQEITETVSGLIRHFARLYGRGCCNEDLFQTGYLGFLKALKSFNSERNTSFLTYVSYAIIGEIRHFVRKSASNYRPGCLIEIQSKVDKVIDEYTKIHGNIPSVAYIAQKLNVKEENVTEVMITGVVSFDEIEGSKDFGLSYDLFGLSIEDKLTLYQAMQKLSGVQKKVIHMLFYQDMTQRQVAEKLGITQKQVSRLKEKSVQILRADMLHVD